MIEYIPYRLGNQQSVGMLDHWLKGIGKLPDFYSQSLGHSQNFWGSAR
jgi:hypothetical protein